MKIKNPEIHKILICSTSHIRKEDNDRLDKGDSDFLMFDIHPFGWNVISIIDSPYKEEGFKKNFIEDGFSEEFYNILMITEELECSRLCLDKDGPEYDELPKFNW
jgi:hypothetical protein